MQATLFHRDIFLPSEIKGLFEGHTVGLDLTEHAKRASRTDRYGYLALPETLTLKGAEIVEAEVVDMEVVKLVVRTSYSATLDAVFALIPNYERATVKTVWFNAKSDTHKTLKRHLYATR